MFRNNSSGNGRAVSSPLATAPTALPAAPPKYEIFREIGRGSASTIYEAYDLELRRHVAIKQLHASFHEDEQHANAFWEEAEFLMAHPHAHLVAIHGVDKARGWIVTELMKGSLAENIRSGAVKPTLVKQVLVQSLAALQFLHQLGKLHGRISPEKLLLDNEGNIKLGSSPGFCLGAELRQPAPTDRHIAPEVLESTAFGAPGPGVDLYCLGTTAIELLTGPEFSRLCKADSEDDEQSAVAWLRWHRSDLEAFPSVASIVPRVPKDLARVIDRLVRKPVAARYATAQEALDDLAGKTVADCPIEMPTCIVSRPRYPTNGTEVLAPPGRAKIPGQHPPIVNQRMPPAGPAPWRVLTSRRGLLAMGLTAMSLLIICLPPNSRQAGVVSQPPQQGLKIIVDALGVGATCRIERREDKPTESSADRSNPFTKEFQITQRETMEDLPDGSYFVTLTKDLFASQTQETKIAGTQERLVFNLERRCYRTKVRVESEDGLPIQNATIRVDDKPLEYVPGTPLDLPPGPHTLLVKADGYETLTKQVQVPSAESAQGIVALLAPERLPIVLIVEPGNAVLELDGKRLEGSSPHEVRVVPGSHVVAVTGPSEEFQPLREKIAVSPQMVNREFLFELKPRKFDLQIVTRPVDATVEVDGVMLPGQSPFLFSQTPGSVRIRVAARDEEYLPQERIVNIGPGTKPEDFVLQRVAQAPVSFHSEPNSALVHQIVPGKPDRLLGSTPFECNLAPGYHDLRLEFGGESLAVSRIHVSSDGGPFFFDLEATLASRGANARNQRFADGRQSVTPLTP